MGLAAEHFFGSFLLPLTRKNKGNEFFLPLSLTLSLGEREHCYNLLDMHLFFIFLTSLLLISCSFHPQENINNVQKSISGAIKHAQDETDKAVQPAVDTILNVKKRAQKVADGVEQMDSGKNAIIEGLTP